MGEHYSHPTVIELADQQAQILNMKRDGMGLREIGKKLGLSHETVRRRLAAAIQDLVTPAAEEVRKIELERLDYYVTKLTKQIENGTQVARNIEVAMKVAERRSKLLGLDAPDKLDATITEVTQEDIALQELLAEARAKNILAASELVSGVPGKPGELAAESAHGAAGRADA